MSNQKQFEKELLDCIKRGKNDHVKFFIQNITGVYNEVDSLGATLLHYAAEYGNGGIAQYLIDLGSNVDAQNLQGQTPLMLAIGEERVTTIRVLLERNASIHITDKNGKSPLHMVAQGSLISESTIQMFLIRLKKETLCDKRLIAQKLISLNCSLRIAIFLDDAEVTRLMLNEGKFNVDEADSEIGETALHIAVRRLSIENVKLLIEYGANVNVFARDYTPLHNLLVEPEDQSLEMLKNLLDRGAMIFTVTGAAKRKCQIRYILERGSKKAINLLMQYDFDLCEVDDRGFTILHYLAQNPNPGVFDELCGREFNVNILNTQEHTPLQLVSKNVSSLKFLVKNGANLNVDRNGITPLIKLYNERPYITNEELTETAEMMLQHGANPQFIPPNKRTIFDCDWRITQFEEDYLSVFQPVLTHLVLLEHTGTPINDVIRGRINEHCGLLAFFELYKRQLDHLKNLFLWESITAYKLLTVSKKQLAIYMRQRELRTILPEKFPENSSYSNIAFTRIEKAIVTAELWENSTSSFCDMLELPYEKYYNVIESMVIDYLSENDMRNLCMLNDTNA